MQYKPLLLTIIGALWATLMAWALGFTVVATSDSYPDTVYRAMRWHNLAWGAGSLLSIASVIIICRDSPSGGRWLAALAACGFISMITAWNVVYQLDRNSDRAAPWRAWILPMFTEFLWLMAYWLYCAPAVELTLPHKTAPEYRSFPGRIADV